MGTHLAQAATTESQELSSPEAAVAALDELQRREPWELPEDFYCVREAWRSLRNGVSRVKACEEALRTVSPRAKRRIATLTRERDWARAFVEGFSPTKYVERNKERLHRQYIEAVTKAIRAQKPVPQELVEQHPELQRARTGFERYLKGRHTSFANRSAAVESSTVATLGCKVKCQDGSRIRDEQIREIGLGLAEVEEAVGPLLDLLQQTDITIAHTSGKHPFMRSAGGLYVWTERTISMGVIGRDGRRIESLAHELGHWLDFEAGRAKGVDVPMFRHSSWGSRSRRFQSTALSDARNAQSMPLLRDALFAMNRTAEVTRALRRASGPETEADSAFRERVRVRLGSYWRERVELWARLFEQYVSTRLGGRAVIAASPDYGEAPGWWTNEAFARLMPRIEEELAFKLEALRGRERPRGMAPEVVLALRADDRSRPWDLGVHAPMIASPLPTITAERVR